jgi:3-methylfumaryl-CoA hydratase
MVEPGQTVTREEACTVAAVRRVCAMLDLDPNWVAEGVALPRGWQFILLAADAPRSSLRADGFPGLGVPMPDLGLARLLLGGRTVVYHQDIPIGTTVQRTSSVKSLVEKSTDAGPMAIVTILNELRATRQNTPAIVETQTYLLLGASKRSPDDAGRERPVTTTSGEQTTTVIPDETLLFQYSALGFNSHKIHLDKTYAREVEGFPDLVVNGGLATLLLTEYLRRDLGVVPAALKVRHIAPLFCGRPLTIAAVRDNAKWRLKALNERNALAVEMEVEVQ